MRLLVVVLVVVRCVGDYRGGESGYTSRESTERERERCCAAWCLLVGRVSDPHRATEQIVRCVLLLLSAFFCLRAFFCLIFCQ